MPIHSSSPIRLVQITDTHLMRDPDAELMGMDTGESLRRVLEQIRLNSPEFDAMVCSGDLTQDSSKLGYQALEAALNEVAPPIYCLPGNHDDLTQMSETLKSDQISCPPSISIGQWHLVFLNSAIPGKTGGCITPQELSRLKQEIETADDKFILCFLHHHPIPIGCDWLDKQIVSNHEELMAVLQSSPAVRGVAWGHVHQEHDSVIDGLRLLSCPSTCKQFTPNSSDFALDDLEPGYRWLNLHTDGTIETGIERTSATL